MSDVDRENEEQRDAPEASEDQDDPLQHRLCSRKQQRVQPECDQYGNREMEQVERRGRTARLLEHRNDAVQDAVENIILRHGEKQAGYAYSENNTDLLRLPPKTQCERSQRQRHYADERVAIRGIAGNKDAQQVNRAQRELLMYSVWDCFAPVDRLVCTNPADRSLTVRIGGPHLQRARKYEERDENEERHNKRSPDPPLLDQEIEPHRACREREKDRHLVMTAQPAHAQKQPGERGAGDRTHSSRRAKQEQKDERPPDRAVDHLRPVGGADVAPKAKRDARHHRRNDAAPEIAAQQVAEQRRQVVNRNVVPGQDREINVALIERKGEQDPVQRISQPRLSLSDKRLPREQKRIPNRKVMGVKLLRLKLEPWNDLICEVRHLQPVVLAGQQQLPEEADDDEKQDGGPGEGQEGLEYQERRKPVAATGFRLFL